MGMNTEEGMFDGAPPKLAMKPWDRVVQQKTFGAERISRVMFRPGLRGRVGDGTGIPEATNSVQKPCSINMQIKSSHLSGCLRAIGDISGRCAHPPRRRLHSLPRLLMLDGAIPLPSQYLFVESQRLVECGSN